MPDLSHLWQRFVLASALVFGLALGVGATIFGYSNTGKVDIGFSVVHLRGIPLWTVAIVPLVVVLAAGTLYHWWNSLHHFSEHMRHRRRVKELEAEVASLKARLDELLEMPGHAETKPSAEVASVETAATNGSDTAPKRQRKRISLSSASETETVATPTDGAPETQPREESSQET